MSPKLADMAWTVERITAVIASAALRRRPYWAEHLHPCDEDDEMSAGSPGEGNADETAAAQDPWSRPADFGQPGQTAAPAQPGQPAPPTSEPGSFASEAPSAWSAPAEWTAPVPASWPATDESAGQQPAGNGASPGAADPQPSQAPAGQPGAVPTGQFGPPPAGPYGYQPTGPYGYQSAYYAPAAVPTNPVAIAALVCGIAQVLGFVVLLGNVLLAVPAVICGAIAMRQIRERGGRGRGMAIAGLVLGIVGIVLFVLFLGLVILGIVFARRSSG